MIEVIRGREGENSVDSHVKDHQGAPAKVGHARVLAKADKDGKGAGVADGCPYLRMAPRSNNDGPKATILRTCSFVRKMVVPELLQVLLDRKRRVHSSCSRLVVAGVENVEEGLFKATYVWHVGSDVAYETMDMELYADLAAGEVCLGQREAVNSKSVVLLVVDDDLSVVVCGDGYHESECSLVMIVQVPVERLLIKNLRAGQDAMVSHNTLGIDLNPNSYLSITRDEANTNLERLTSIHYFG